VVRTRRLAAALVAVAAVGIGGCSNNIAHTRRVAIRQQSTTTSSVVTSTSTVTSAAPAPSPPVTFPTIGQRTFAITGVALAEGNWLTVGLHPTTTPVELHASTSEPLEVCPAGLDGGLTDSSWPTYFNFSTCIVMASGNATLPPTNGSFHVAFAVRTVSATASASLTLTVDYAATDTFVEVIPPSSASTSLTVTFTPRTSTTAASVSPAGLVTPAPGYTLTISQAGRVLDRPAPCDFPTEAQDCVGAVTPGGLTELHIAGPGSQVVVYPAWQ
jgi:hypothetical protein